MEKVKQFCKDLAADFAELIQHGKDMKDSTVQSLKTNSQYLAACIKRSPALIRDENVMEIISLLSAPHSSEDPKVFDLCQQAVNVCLNSLPPESVREVWDGSSNIDLCYAAAMICQPSQEAYFRRLLEWIRHPNADQIFLRRLYGIIKMCNDGQIKTEFLIPFASLIVDPDPLRSSLSTLVLLSFKTVNSEVSKSIAAAWLSTQDHRPHSASNCRSVLSNASPSALNFVAALGIEFPSILCILPPKTPGFDTLCQMTIHRMKSFYPKSLQSLLICSDPRVRKMNKTLCGELPIAIQIIDSVDLSCLPSPELFASEKNLDLLTASVMFARDTSAVDSSFIGSNDRQLILEAIKEPKQNSTAREEGEIVDQTKVSNLIAENKILEISRTAAGVAI